MVETYLLSSASASAEEKVELNPPSAALALSSSSEKIAQPSLVESQ